MNDGTGNFDEKKYFNFFFYDKKIKCNEHNIVKDYLCVNDTFYVEKYIDDTKSHMSG